MWRCGARDRADLSCDRRGAGRVHPRTGGRATRCAPRSLRSLRQTSVSFFSFLLTRNLPSNVARRPAAAARRQSLGAGSALARMGDARRESRAERALGRQPYGRRGAPPTVNSTRLFLSLSLSLYCSPSVNSTRFVSRRAPASREGRGGAREELSVRPSSRRLLCRRLARERARRAGPPER